MNIESAWAERVKSIKLYKYEFSPDNFILLDEIAGYNISYNSEVPVKVTEITDVMSEILKRGVEVKFLPEIKTLADEIVKSGLNYSIIRMPK